MTKKTKVYFYYCTYCKKEVLNPVKPPMESFHKHIWVVIILATLGFAVIALFIYRKYIVKKHNCPTCLSKLKITEQPLDSKTLAPKKPSTPKEQILEKVEELGGIINNPNTDDLDKIFCPFCGEELEKDIVTCPYCQTAIKF